MKKLSYMLSALLAAVGFSSAASADVSVSGSGSVTVSADGTNTETILASGIAFALSTTTANGMSISTSGSVSNGTTVQAAAAGGFSSVAFATGGSTITIGKVEVPNGVGDVGPAASDMTKQGGNKNDADSAFGVNGTVEAAGVSLATAVGGASVSIGYVYNAAGTTQGDISGTNTATGVSISMPVGNITTTLGYVTDGTQNQSGATAAVALGGGTLTVGYGATTASAANETSMGAKYAMSLDADTSMTLGYNSTKGEQPHTKTGVALSRSIGGGASVFLEAINYAGEGATAGTDIGIGTSFAF